VEQVAEQLLVTTELHHLLQLSQQLVVAVLVEEILIRMVELAVLAVVVANKAVFTDQAVHQLQTKVLQVHLPLFLLTVLAVVVVQVQLDLYMQVATESKQILLAQMSTTAVVVVQVLQTQPILVG
jgi:hypothetical protein